MLTSSRTDVWLYLSILHSTLLLIQDLIHYKIVSNAGITQNIPTPVFHTMLDMSNQVVIFHAILGCHITGIVWNLEETHSLPI